MERSTLQKQQEFSETGDVLVPGFMASLPSWRPRHQKIHPGKHLVGPPRRG